jgi:hypothetical protein
MCCPRGRGEWFRRPVGGGRGLVLVLGGVEGEIEDEMGEETVGEDRGSGQP